MQCPLSSGCMFSKVVFLATGGLGFVLGLLSVIWPARSISLYQWIMERFNWKVAPIDLPREIRNTRALGIVLTALSLVIVFTVFFRL